jgi:tetratricopeptide (TPR) repeat protein
MVSSAGAGADPKDKIEIANQVQEALLAQEDGRPQDAIPILEKVVAKDPNIAGAHQILGSLLMERNEFGRAVSVLRKAVELRHSSADHYTLGLALFRAGDLESAKTELEAAIAKPSLTGPYGRAKEHYALAGVYNGLGRTADSTRELQAAVRLDPDNYDSNLNLGRMLSMQGSAAAGLPYLQKAASLQPQRPDPHFFLADVYGQLGQQADATKERLEAQRLRASGQP